MRIIVDVNHPAHVHFFRHFVLAAREHGHDVLITATRKDVAFALLDHYDLGYEVLGDYGRSLLSKAVRLPLIDWRLWRVARRFRPRYIMGIGSFRAAHVSRLIRGCESLVFTDTEHASEQIALYRPFAHHMLTPTCFGRDFGARHVRYRGYHELAYLHPRRFAADGAVLADLGIPADRPIFVVRFVSWDATHDVGNRGFSAQGKRELIRLLSAHGTTLISAEGALPDDLAEHRLSTHPAQMHQVLAHASLYVGEGATMASEAALLGVPALYVNTLGLGYIEEQARAGLVFHIPDEAAALAKAEELAGAGVANRVTFGERRDLLLRDKVDVTDWMLEYCLGAESRG